ncbi:UNVERIFIED_CONTAM: hypothetical protein FKN15_045038 [Acipenser sinensis]
MAAISSQALKLRVIVEADNIRKITLDTCPESVDDLKRILKDKLKLDADFSLQYEDPDFDGELISLVDIDELPQKATLKLFMAEVEDSDEPDVGDAPVAILTVVSDDTEKPIHFNPIKISIVLESEVMAESKYPHNDNMGYPGYGYGTDKNGKAIYPEAPVQEKREAQRSSVQAKWSMEESQGWGREVDGWYTGYKVGNEHERGTNHFTCKLQVY